MDSGSDLKSGIYIVSAVRTAIGTFGGSLKDVAPATLGAHVVKHAIQNGGIDPAHVDHVVWGQVIQTEPRDAYIGRVAAVDGGVPVATPAMTVNRLCGSGLQAVISAAQSVRLGEAGVAIAGGSESMSRAPYLNPAMRWGAKMGDAASVDMLEGALRDPFHRILMGQTAENVAERYGIDRTAQDELALLSHQRASNAIRSGRFKDQIVGIEVKSGRKLVTFAEDEHVRHDAKVEDLAKLRPIFRQDERGTVTAGNASGINDGAAAMVLASEDAIARHGAEPLCRIVAWAHAGVEPEYMGIGPVPATQKALARAGLSVRDLDVIESNEAFAAQACAVMRELDLDPEKVNPNGSGISLGHPVGATGAINVVKAAYELRRIGGRYALVTMCIGGGQGIALILERS